MRFTLHRAPLPWLFFTALIVVYLAIEVLFLGLEPSNLRIQQIAKEDVLKSTSAFQDFQQTFRKETIELSEAILNAHKQNASLESIQELLSTKFQFWGTALYFNDSLVVWSGFSKGEFKPSVFETDLPFSMEVLTEGNVVYIQGEKSFTSINGNDTLKFHLATLQRLQQQNLLNIGKNLEVTVPQALDISLNYPVYFSFFQSLPQSFDFKQSLVVNGYDTVGVAYAKYSDFDFFNEHRKSSFYKWRFLCLFLILITVSFLASKSTFYLHKVTNLLITFALVILCWVFLGLSLPSFGFNNLLGDDPAIIGIANLFLDTLTLLLLAIIGTRFYLKNASINSNISVLLGLLISTILGLIFAQVFLNTTSNIFEIVANTQLSIFAIKPIPALSTVLFFLATGFLWISLSWLTVNLLLTLFIYFQKREFLILLFTFTGFSIGLLLAFTFRFHKPEIWQLIQATFLFLALAFISIQIRMQKFRFQGKSRVRLLILVCFIASILGYVPSYFGEVQEQNEQMINVAESFNLQEGDKAEEITITLLTSLEFILSAQQYSNVDTQKPSLQAFFDREVPNLILPQWEDYSFSVQLVDQGGESISEYTTDLNAPGWTKIFDVLSLEVPFEEERIKRDRLRPIIREKALEQPSTSYSSYRQGWIPFYTSSDDGKRLGWIICSVYKEKPQYRKALRAVVSYAQSQGLNTTIHLNEFEDGLLNRTSIVGIPLDLPSYSRLNKDLIVQIQKDSILIRNTEISRSKLREMFIANDAHSITRVASLRITATNHIYSLLRFFFTLLIVLILISIFFFWSPSLKLIGHNKKFKDRLLDRFILASLACFLALVAASYAAIISQSNESVTDEISMKLENLIDGIIQDSVSDTRKLLYNATSIIDADAILYKDNTEIGSTAPQIFSQNLLPTQIPWDVYNEIYFKGSEQEIRFFTLGSQEMLIGFKPIIKNNKIINIAGIPTFLRAPRFNEQVLSTTSYLLGLFVLIFGLFILGATFIANQLTSPLEELSEGIKTISDGNLETTLPVKSQDEIGALTNAYNIMVYRLQELQKNLVEAEREAAWKEMAQQVAHEIKNPLTPMKLNLQHLERKLKSPDITTEELKTQFSKVNTNLIEQIDSLSRIASDFSKFAKPIDQPLRRFDITELLLSVLDLYAHEKKVAITSLIPTKHIYVDGVKDELRRAFINLIKNGIEAMEADGTITLATNITAQHVEISISDTGEGISEKNKSVIFIPNFSTKTSGTGLGLAITKKIIEAHHGEISFTSSKGKGTTFVITLPLSVK
mgnify:CR=1 FL=1|tara:strand:+ start:6836 stop:10672 length:3837 start_codon:yes stop_codon:yes gene_type:complete